MMNLLPNNKKYILKVSIVIVKKLKIGMASSINACSPST